MYKYFRNFIHYNDLKLKTAIINSNAKVDALNFIYHVWAFGRLSVDASIRWIVNNLGPAAPVEPKIGSDI